MRGLELTFPLPVLAGQGWRGRRDRLKELRQALLRRQIQAQKTDPGFEDITAGFVKGRRRHGFLREDSASWEGSWRIPLTTRKV